MLDFRVSFVSFGEIMPVSICCFKPEAFKIEL